VVFPHRTPAIAEAAARMRPPVDVRPELEALGRRLRAGEAARELVVGARGGEHVLLAVTDHRVMLLRERRERQASVALPLSALRSARWDPAPGAGTLTLRADVGGLRIDQVARGDAQRVISRISSTTPPLPSPLIADPLSIRSLAEPTATQAAITALAAPPSTAAAPHQRRRPRSHRREPSRAERRRLLLAAGVTTLVVLLATGIGLTWVLARGDDRPDTGRPIELDCSVRAGDPAGVSRALHAARPGDRVCLTADLAASRLTIASGGTPARPVTVLGTGRTVVKGITVTADNVVVLGFRVLHASAPGILIKGDNITVQDNTVIHPIGGDYDGLRFFGTNLKILDNLITDISPDGSGAHADCMQTFATDSDSPPSRNVLIDGNRCVRIDNQCLIAEGPNSVAGDGAGLGVSEDITFSHNFCDVHASQATEIDDVRRVRVVGNKITGTPDKAFSFQNKATDALVAANTLAKQIKYQVGMDASSHSGYTGPAVGGPP
jgi:hypothetical protein